MSASPSGSLWARLFNAIPPVLARPLPLSVTVLFRAFALAFVVIWMLGGAPFWLALLGLVLGAVTWRVSSMEPQAPSAPSGSAAPAPVASEPSSAPAREAPGAPLAPVRNATVSVREALKHSSERLRHAVDASEPLGLPGPQPWSQPLQLPETFAFEYSDAEGAITQRTVIIRSAGISAGRRRYLSGTCTQAHAQRTFRLDRISGWLERTSDGELFDPKEVYKAAGPPEAVETNPANFRSAPASEPSRPWQTAVVFAGFSAAKREELEALAEAAGWQVRTGITKTVDYLVAGPMAGPRQQERAVDLGVIVLDEDVFREMT